MQTIGDCFRLRHCSELKPGLVVLERYIHPNVGSFEQTFKRASGGEASRKMCCAVIGSCLQPGRGVSVRIQSFPQISLGYADKLALTHRKPTELSVLEVER